MSYLPLTRHVVALAILGIFTSGSRLAAQSPPREALESLAVDDDLAIQLWASEPDVVNPTNFDIDEQGRIWVTEAANYRSQLSRPQGDRIMILTDTDQDGRCDRAQVFYQGRRLQAPLGICKLGNKLYVSQSPDLLVFTIDESGDKPVGEPEVLLTGFGGKNHDHGLHAMIFGPDGRFYANAGNEGMRSKILDAQRKPVVDTTGSHVGSGGTLWRGEARGDRLGYQQGMAFRFRPDGSEFETLGHNFRNNYELAVDSFGTIWQSDNDDDGNQSTRLNYVMEGGNFGYHGPTGNNWRRDMAVFPDQTRQQAHWHQRYPGVVPNLVHTGAGSPSGMTIYEGQLLGRELRGAILHCDPGPRTVRAFLPTPSRNVPDGLMDPDAAPDETSGAGYAVAVKQIIHSEDSWFRPVDVCVAPDGAVFIADWYDSRVGGHATGDLPDNGGLRGRIYRLAPRGNKPTLPELNLTTVAGALDALNSPNQARRYLGFQMLAHKPAAFEALQQQFGSATDLTLRARALWVLAHHAEGPAVIRQALRDEDQNIRITAIRAALLADMNMIDVAQRMLDDRSPGVLRELALAMKSQADASAIPILVQLANRFDGDDRWYLEAIGIGAAGREAKLLRAWTAANASPNAQVAQQLRWRLRGAVAVQEIASLRTRYVSQWNFLGPFRARDKLNTEFPPEKQPGEIDLKGSAAGIDGEKITWQLIQTEPIEDARYVHFSTWLEQRKIDLTNAVGFFATSIETPYAQEATLLIGADDQAIAWLNGREVFRSERGGALVVDANKVPLQLDPGPNLLLVKLFNNAGGTALAVGVRVNDPRQTVSFSLELPSAADRQAARKRAEELLNSSAGQQSGPPVTKDNRVLPDLDTLAKMNGDPERGQKVFHRREATSCVACHQVGREGKLVGPPLTAIGDKLDRKQLFDAILHPSRGVLMGYENWTVVTTDGQVITGLKDADTPSRVTIKDATGGYHDIPAEQVEEKRLMKLSLMPAGLAKSFTQQELIDLVAYLATLKNKP